MADQVTTRLTFSIDSLRKQIEARREAEIKSAHDEYASENVLEGRHKEWRETQEKRIKALARGLANKPDAVLAGFTVPSPPSRGNRYRTPEDDLERAVQAAHQKADKSLRRLESLTTKYTINLTPKMLDDYFGI